MTEYFPPDRFWKDLVYFLEKEHRIWKCINLFSSMLEFMLVSFWGTPAGA